MLQIGDTFTIEFSYNQDQVNDFCRISGDFNPLHWDESFSANTIFKKPIIHGALVASMFSKVMGMDFPGKGSIYLSQFSEFKRPLYVDVVYKAIFEISSINSVKHSAEIKTQVFELERGKLMVDGVAQVLNPELF
jgi:acyl dehydratase